MNDRPKSVRNQLWSNEIQWEYHKPVTDDENYLYSLVETSGSIIGDHDLLPEYRTVKSDAEFFFSRNSSVLHCYTEFNRETQKFQLVDDRYQIYKRLKEIFLEGVYLNHYSVEEGLPLYLEYESGFKEFLGSPQEAEYFELFSGRDHQDEYFRGGQMLTEKVLPLIDKLFFSEYQERTKSMFFCQYEYGGSRELEIRRRAFRLFMEGKLFDENPSLDPPPMSYELDSRTEDGLMMTIGLLAKALADKSGNAYMSGNKISASAMTQDLLAALPDIRGLGETSVRKRISDGIKRLNDQLPGTED